MYCLIQKVYNNFNTKPNYFNATYANNNAVIEYIQFPKMLRTDNVKPIERSQPGQPLKWYANDFAVKFAVSDLFKSSLNKNIYDFLQPDNSKNFAYWLYYGTALTNIQWAGEIDMNSYSCKLYPGEYSIECSVVSFEKHLELYLKAMRSKRFSEADTNFYVTQIFNPYTDNNPVLRFSHPSWDTAPPLNIIPKLAVPLYNAWIGQLLGTQLGVKTAWDVFQAYIMETGAAWRIDPEPVQTVNGFRTYTVKMFFPNQNNNAITISKTQNYTEGFSVSEKPYFMSLLVRYEDPNDPSQYVSGRYGYIFIRALEAIRGYVTLYNPNPAIEGADVIIEHSYQQEAYMFASRGFGVFKSDLLELNELAYWKDINGYKIYVSFARCIVVDWGVYPNGDFHDHGFNLVANVLMKNLEYLANGRKVNCQFETLLDDNAKYAVSVNNFKGKNWWILSAELVDSDKSMTVKLIEK